MTPARLLHHELAAFLALIGVIIVWRALTGTLVLTGLLTGESGNGSVHPERVQLLLATLLVSAFYLRDVLHGSGTAMPDIGTPALVAFGASGTAYAAIKAARFGRFSKLQR